MGLMGLMGLIIRKASNGEDSQRSHYDPQPGMALCFCRPCQFVGMVANGQ